MNTDFYLERRLKQGAPELHQRAVDSVFILQGMLENFLPRFPDFTDHSLLHSMDVLDYCNRLLGTEQIDRLSMAECYVLIMACYLHDIGMGVNQKDYEELSRGIDFGDYFEKHANPDASEVIRSFHHEYSGLFIRKYAELLELPTEELLFATIQVSRGHRKTDLFDTEEYPLVQTEYGPIRTAALGAVIRLADEIDVGADRNSELLFDSSARKKREDIEAFGTHESIRHVEILPDRLVLHVKPKTPEFLPLVVGLNEKIRQTLDYCRRVTEQRSELRITQESSEIVLL